MLSFFERSKRGGRPVNLFRFRYGPWDSDVYAYTDHEAAIVHQGITYAPVPIERGAFSSSGSLDKQSLEIAMAGDSEVAELFRVYPPPQVVALTIFQGHVTDPENEYLAIWVGRVLTCAWRETEVALQCEPARTQLRRVGLRRHYQYMCPHVLYGSQCRASEAAATQQARVAGVSGRFLTLESAPANPDHFVGGIVRWRDAVERVNARAILAVAGEVLTLGGIPQELAVGAAVEVLYGCGHTLEACRDVHDNVANFGGHPYIPTKNPLGIYGAFS